MGFYIKNIGPVLEEGTCPRGYSYIKTYGDAPLSWVTFSQEIPKHQSHLQQNIPKHRSIFPKVPKFSGVRKF